MADEPAHRHDPNATEAASPRSDEPETIQEIGDHGNVPERIGQYRLKRVIGHGGMGTVYEAVQDQPSRVVALKVMKPGIASPASLRRFEHESRILGRLRHPGIAQVYEAGTHDFGSGGVPFFAMEYVAGAKVVTEYARVKSLALPRRLELFCRVCEAVQHGHQKGIIHRDLKPDNILVDSTGQPKIIDFGIARATDANVAMVTLQTRVGDLVGTLPYMSPEQVEADPHDLDIRSDVYALGVVLYELLCGELPYDLEDTAVYEATRIIREKPPKPLRLHDQQLKGDIETIVLKALEKERERRYASASDLHADIQRFLDAEPISARPPSLTYHVRLFARRNRALFGASAVALAALVIGCVAATVGFVQARQARDEAMREADTAQAIVGYFQNMFSSLDAREATGPDTRVKDVLDHFAADVETRLGDQPEVRAAIQSSIGSGYKAISDFTPAETQLRQALDIQQQILPDPHPDTAQTMEDLASVLWFKGEFVEAEKLYRQTLEMRTRIFGPEHEEVASSLNFIAAALDARKKHDEAEPLFREALAMRQRVWHPRHEMVARSINNLASSLSRQGRNTEAEPLYREAVAIVRETRGADHIDVAGGLTNLARCLSRLDRLDEAESAFRDALRIKLAKLDADHHALAVTQHHLASLLLRRSGDGASARLDEAESLCREALRIRRLAFEPPHTRIVATTDLLGRILMARRDWPAAEPHLRTLVELRKAQYPDGDARVHVAQSTHGECLTRLERFDEAEGLLITGYTRLQNLAGDDDPATLAALRRIIAHYHAWERPERAVPYETLLRNAGDGASSS